MTAHGDVRLHIAHPVVLHPVGLGTAHASFQRAMPKGYHTDLHSALFQHFQLFVEPALHIGDHNGVLSVLIVHLWDHLLHKVIGN